MTNITDNDVCEFFGFSKNLAICNPGGMVMMLAGLRVRGYKYAVASGLGTSVMCRLSRIEDITNKDSITVNAPTPHEAVLIAVKQLIGKERDNGKV